MSQASEAVQRIVFARLNGAISCPVYDEPPETPAYPYVTIGDARESAQNRFGHTAREVLAQVDVWSRSGPDAAQDGYGEALTIAAAIDALLDNYAPATTDGWTVDLVDFQQQSTMRHPQDQTIRRALLVYRFVVER